MTFALILLGVLLATASCLLGVALVQRNNADRQLAQSNLRQRALNRKADKQASEVPDYTSDIQAKLDDELRKQGKYVPPPIDLDSLPF